ncbi:MAG: mechanosensitive ion channel family protein, partial [Bdellovibrionota bacterium]
TVLLVNFGDSSLDFELIYWHRVDINYGAGAIRSEIRLKILELFEANKVSIPFPHREVIMQANEPRA